MTPVPDRLGDGDSVDALRITSPTLAQDLARRHADHDLHHLDQLTRYIEAASESIGDDLM